MGGAPQKTPPEGHRCEMKSPDASGQPASACIRASGIFFTQFPRRANLAKSVLTARLRQWGFSRENLSIFVILVILPSFLISFSSDFQRHWARCRCKKKK